MEALSQHLWVGFTGGVLAAGHCLGMCGGFALHLSREPDRKSMICSHALWQLGRVIMYVFLGAAAGYAGGLAEHLQTDLVNIQNVVSVAAGIFILFMGINLLGLMPVGKNSLAHGTLFPEICSRLTNSPSPGAAFFLGLVTGCLPCPIVLAFLAYSLQTGTVVGGMATMAAVGTGTMLPLLLIGMAGRWVQLREWGVRVGGLILILLGIGTMLRGTAIHHHLWGCSTGVVHGQTLSGSHGSCRTVPDEVRNGSH